MPAVIKLPHSAAPTSALGSGLARGSSGQRTPHDDVTTVAGLGPVSGGHPARGGGRGRGVLEGAVEVLDALSRFEPAGLSDLARLIGLPKTTVHRLLEQMTALDLVDRLDNGNYRIGGGLRRLGAPDRALHGLAQIGRAPVAALSARTRSAITLVVLRERTLVVAASGAVERGLDLSDAQTSRRLDTAVGQVLLAAAPESEPPSSMSPREWQRACTVIRRENAAFDRQDLVDGICCVAVPVRNRDGAVVAALASIMLARQIPVGVAEQIRHTAARLGQQLAGPLDGPTAFPAHS